MTEETVKLQKFISDCGLMSRRAAEASICCGEFTVNGQPASLRRPRLPDTRRRALPREAGAGRGAEMVYYAQQAARLCDDDVRRARAEKRGRAGRRPAGARLSDRAAGYGQRGAAADDQRRRGSANRLAHPSFGHRKVYGRHGRRLRPERGGRPAARDARAGRRTDCALRGGHPRAVRAGEPGCASYSPRGRTARFAGWRKRSACA